MSIQLNQQQSEARDGILGFIAQGDDDSYVMAGLAGTGKTTLVCEILGELKSRGKRIALIAPTGKAATVLNSKQQHYKATTIHSLLYKRPNDAMSELIDQIEAATASLEFATANGPPERVTLLQDEISGLKAKLDGVYCTSNKLTFHPRDPEEVRQNFDCIFVDEASMVGEDLIRDINQLRLPTVYLGDPNQLFPVGQDRFSVRLDKPNVRLTEIMRQGADSPILSLSREILKAKGMPRNFHGVPTTRNSNPLPTFNKFNGDIQFICYMNNTRRGVNKTLRDVIVGAARDKEYPFLPVTGERLMIDANEPDKGLMKGDVVTCNRVLYYRPDGKREDYIATIECTDRLGVKQSLAIHLNDLMLTEGHKMGISDNRGGRTEYENDHYRFCAGAYYQATKVLFPYAITCHKAQGSEWKNVAVYNDPHASAKVQYLYTAVTRAREGLELLGVY